MPDCRSGEIKRACPVCGTNAPATPARRKNGFAIHRCGSCTLMFVVPQPAPEELERIYDAGYFERGNKYAAEHQATGRRPTSRPNDAARISRVQEHVQVGRLLDVGCALGGFLSVAREQGFDVVGVEPSEPASRHVRDKLGIEAVNADLPSAGLPDESFDVVTLWDVIEHVADPLATLTEAERVLRPGGALLLSTGNAASLWARATGRYWQLLTPPQHLFFHTPASLRHMLTRSGLRTVEIRSHGKWVTFGFALFKARETLGRVIWPLQAVARSLRLDSLRLYVNLFDIMTCVAEKASAARRKSCWGCAPIVAPGEARRRAHSSAIQPEE
ncbi:class I SAM-dependent methyltransferase [Planctomycetota bacterium]